MDGTPPTRFLKLLRPVVEIPLHEGVGGLFPGPSAFTDEGRIPSAVEKELPNVRAPEKVVFGHTVEGLLSVLEGHLEGPLRPKLKAVGLDLDQKLEPAYPKDQWHQMLLLAAEALFPGLSPPQAHWHLGERFVTAYFSTNMGRALKGVLKLLGPARTLERTARNMASGSNFLLVDVARLSATDYRLKVSNGGVHPEFIGALCHFGTLTTGVKGLSTVVEGREGPAAMYRMRW
ncbi:MULTISPECIES: DUF2378 family protein [unclassified Corallococcus]|uniref:DUF2378 family protein n=1 Tax=unclassified Corallococcus TaxID=2685029 RepID=UPI001A8FFD06|nr:MULTISPECIES: DUF2378 family protein [unclassified Corallococcus]MBN9681270.1 DUF2378 family protein [Corallococcus sp. NCSPR001]WAS87150.1 DUF2378 family protein [Corallococcus sp. NCRR]